MKHIKNSLAGMITGGLVGFFFSAATKIPLGENPVTDHVMYALWSALLTLTGVPIVVAFLILLGASLLKYPDLHPLRLIAVAFATLFCPVLGPVFGAGGITMVKLITMVTLMGAAGGAFWGLLMKPTKLPRSGSKDRELEFQG
jgi:hypothetical protein